MLRATSKSRKAEFVLGNAGNAKTLLVLSTQSTTQQKRMNVEDEKEKNQTMNNRPLALLKNPLNRKRKPYVRIGHSDQYNGWMKEQNLWGFPCPKCHRLTMFREDKNPEIFVCLECGYEKRRKPLSGGYLRLKEKHTDTQPERDELAREIEKTWKQKAQV